MEHLAHMILKRIGNRVSPRSCRCRPQTPAVGTFGVTHCVDSNVVGLSPRGAGSGQPTVQGRQGFVERSAKVGELIEGGGFDAVGRGDG